MIVQEIVGVQGPHSGFAGARALPWTGKTQYAVCVVFELALLDGVVLSTTTIRNTRKKSFNSLVHLFLKLGRAQD